jgi:hypothetical protein
MEQETALKHPAGLISRKAAGYPDPYDGEKLLL